MKKEKIKNIIFFQLFIFAILTVPQSEVQAQSLTLTQRTWTPYLLPTNPANGPMQQGHGSKHTRIFYNSTSRHMVITGGDYNNEYISDGGSQLVWTKDLSTVGSTPNWNLIGPWCMETGQIQPARPDSVGWAYDSKRNVGVVMPGFYMGTENNYSNCQSLQGKNPLETNDSTTFSFSNNIWSVATYLAPKNGYGGDIGSSFSVYDPITDSVIRFRDACCVEVLNRSTNEWSYFNVLASPTRYTNRAQLAIDVTGRCVYAIETVSMHLLRWNIDTHSLTDLGRLPSSYIGPNNPTGVEFETYLVFDSINRVLISPDVANFEGLIRGLVFYHSDTGIWDSYETVSGPIQGYPVKGNTFGFDPANNVIISIGGHGGTYGDPNVYWLYRYGEGSSIDTQAPATPTGLRIN